MSITLSKNGRIIRQFASREEMVASELRPSPTSVGNPMVNVGNVAPVSNDMGGVPFPDNFSVELANACAAPKDFLIGDPTGMIALAAGGTFLNPTGCSLDGAVKGSGVSAMKQLFGLRGLAVRGFNYATSSKASQFSQKLMEANAEINGAFMRNPINVAIQRRNNAMDDLLMTLELVTPFVFNSFRGLVLRVEANETVNLEFSVFMLS